MVSELGDASVRDNRSEGCECGCFCSGDGRSAAGGSGTSAGESEAGAAATYFGQPPLERALRRLLAEIQLRLKGHLRVVVLRVLAKARLALVLESAASISAEVRTSVGPAPAEDRVAPTGPGVA
jgi:hypothetical protein